MHMQTTDNLAFLLCSHVVYKAVELPYQKTMLFTDYYNQSPPLQLFVCVSDSFCLGHQF